MDSSIPPQESGFLSREDDRWMLHVPYVAPELDITEPLVKTLSGYRISIQSTVPSRGNIIVRDLNSVERSYEVFEALKRGCVTASLNLSSGIRVRDELSVFHHDEPLPSDRDRPFTCPQGRSLARVIISAGEPKFQTEKVSGKLWQSLDTGFRNSDVEQALKNPRVALACQLFIDGQFETSDEARLLSFMSALEVLKDRDDAPPAVQQLVGKWMEETTHLDAPERDSIRSTLNFMKSISISRGIRGVVERHLGQEQAREVNRLYGIRSKLVHDGKRPAELGQAARQTESIARDLLVTTLLAAGRLA